MCQLVGPLIGAFATLEVFDWVFLFSEVSLSRVLELTT